MNPTDTPTSNEDLLQRLLAAAEALDHAILAEDDRTQAEAAIRAFELLHAPRNDYEASNRSPHEWQTLDYSITTHAWCVVKHDERSMIEGGRVWPGQAYLDLELAYGWCEFLEDFYYDTKVLDGTERWVVEWREVEVKELVRANNKHTTPGEGYHNNRSNWVGTLPMRKFKRVKEDLGNGYVQYKWVRIQESAEA